MSEPQQSTMIIMLNNGVAEENFNVMMTMGLKNEQLPSSQD